MKRDHYFSVILIISLSTTTLFAFGQAVNRDAEIIKRKTAIIGKTSTNFVITHLTTKPTSHPKPKILNFNTFTLQLKKIPFLKDNTDNQLLYTIFKELYINYFEELCYTFTVYNYGKESLMLQTKAFSLPVWLLLFPAVVSGYDSRYASASGHGMWRLPYPVAIKYGLRINTQIDERYSMVHSTHAALSYMRDLFNSYKSLDAAILAYLTSPVTLNNILEDAQDFNTVLDRLPADIKIEFHFFKALVLIHYLEEESGIISISEFAEQDTTHVAIEKNIHLPTLLRILRHDSLTFMFNNPTVKGLFIDSTYLMVLPDNLTESFKDNEASIYKLTDSLLHPPALAIDSAATANSKGPVYHIVKRGETLSQIAEKYPGVSVNTIVKLNKLKSPDKISEGQRLLIYE